MIELLTIFLDNILPIILVAGVGFILQRVFNIDPRPISIVVFYALAPCLIFNIMLTSDLDGNDILRMVGFGSAVIFSMIFIVWIFSTLRKVKGTTRSSMMLSTAFMNSGNYGLSISQFAFGSAGLAWAGIYFVTSAFWTNSLGVLIGSAGRQPLHKAILQTLKLPLVYAVLAALLFRSIEFSLPLPLQRPIDLLASATVPIMLVVLGMQISKSGLPQRKGLLLTAVFLRLGVSPILGWFLASAMNLTGVTYNVGILQSAMPTAVMSTIIAMEFDSEPRFVTGAVLVSTLLSPFTLTPLLALLGG